MPSSVIATSRLSSLTPPCPMTGFAATGNTPSCGRNGKRGSGISGFDSLTAISIKPMSRNQELLCIRVPSTIRLSKSGAEKSGSVFRSNAHVVGQTLQGVKCVYPVLVLAKVQVVNDIVDDHPFLIVANPFAPPEKAYRIYDANHDGHRLTMAATGYFHDGKPLLCDRGTQSLWVEDEQGMTAIAGQHKRQKLAQVASPTPVTWKAWLGQNATGRLLVGADRTRGIPSE